MNYQVFYLWLLDLKIINSSIFSSNVFIVSLIGHLNPFGRFGVYMCSMKLGSDLVFPYKEIASLLPHNVLKTVFFPHIVDIISHSYVVSHILMFVSALCLFINVLIYSYASSILL